MRTPFAILVMLIISTGALAQSNKIGVFQFEKKEGSHTARIVFHTKTFERSRHRVTGDDKYQTRVDGHLAIGTDGNLPSVEIDSMRLYFDRNEIKIPSKLYADCFEPNLDSRYVKLEFGRNFQSVIISMSGSDGAGGYEVIWRLKKNGRHRRSISQGF